MNNYGIDLGTSNCLIAKVVQNLDDTFDVKCLTDDEGEESFPSVVYFETENKYKIGENACKHLLTDPDSTIELIKIRLGKTDKINVRVDNRSFNKSPQEISSYLLSHFNVIHDEDINEAVVTVPAFFDQNQKDATMQAGEIADITPKSLIEEPTAAIMYHIFSEYKKHGIDFMNESKKNVLVFDFGGGTLDLSLIELVKKGDQIIPTVVAIGGDEELGGNNIDFIFVKNVLNLLKRKFPKDKMICDSYEAYEEYYENYRDYHILKFPEGTSKEVKSYIFRLKRNLEKVKIELSNNDKSVIVTEHGKIPIDRKDFEKIVLNSDDINIKNKISDALEDISIKANEKRCALNEVLLIGGSAQIPYVKDIIIEAFAELNWNEDHIIMTDDFSRAVAKGAAIQSAIMSGIPIPPFMYNKCSSIVPRDIEIENTGKSQLFIKRGTKYPLEEKVTHKFKIGHSLSDTVSLKLNEIVDKDTKRQICDFDFYLPIYYTNDEIEISMDIDEAGLYKIEAIHDNTGEAVEFEPNKKYSLDRDEIYDIKDELDDMEDIS